MKNIARALSVALVLVALGSVDAQDARSRRFQSGNQALDLDGTVMGFLHSAGGGDAAADVVTEIIGPGQTGKKHLAQVKYGNIDLQIGFGMEPGVFRWIQESWSTNAPRKNGGIHQLDFNFNAVSQRKFFDALITETTIPACDGSVREPAYIGLKLAPETTRDEKSSGNVGSFRQKQKSWNPANFRLTIGGLDCSRVAKIDAFTVKMTPAPGVVGEDRIYLQEPGKIDYPNLKITLPQASAETWQAWFEDFVIKGNCSDDREKTGKLEFLSANRREVLLTINFSGLGIFRFSPEAADAKSCDCDLCETVVAGANSGDRIRRMTAQLYCEKMDFLPPSPIVGGD